MRSDMPYAGQSAFGAALRRPHCPTDEAHLLEKPRRIEALNAGTSSALQREALRRPAECI